MVVEKFPGHFLFHFCTFRFQAKFFSAVPPLKLLGGCPYVIQIEYIEFSCRKTQYKIYKSDNVKTQHFSVTQFGTVFIFM